MEQMNVHDCVRCGNPINYDDTDWCDVCDMSIFDDRMVKRKKMLTIKNFESSLLDNWCGGWKITDVLDEVYNYDDDLNLLGPPQYSIRFAYYTTNIYVHSGANYGMLYLNRHEDDVLKGKYRYKIYLNQQMINSGGFTKKELEDKNKFIDAVVYTLDYELKKQLK